MAKESDPKKIVEAAMKQGLIFVLQLYYCLYCSVALENVENTAVVKCGHDQSIILYSFTAFVYDGQQGAITTMFYDVSILFVTEFK